MAISLTVRPARAETDAVLEAMHHHPYGQNAALIGCVTDEHRGVVTARTAIGGRRIVDLPVGELLPRIC